jgi:predicted amidohydrolase YtcJ
MFVDRERLAELRALDAVGRLRPRVNAYLAVSFSDEKFGDWYLDHQPRHAYSRHLRLAGVKLFLDHEWGTAFHWDQAELDRYALTAHRNGWQVAAHAVSAEAHDQFLTSAARAQAAFSLRLSLSTPRTAPSRRT